MDILRSSTANDSSAGLAALMVGCSGAGVAAATTTIRATARAALLFDNPHRVLWDRAVPVRSSLTAGQPGDPSVRVSMISASSLHNVAPVPSARGLRSALCATRAHRKSVSSSVEVASWVVF